MAQHSGRSQVDRYLEMPPGRKIQYPTREEWKHQKDEIVRLYVKEDMRLDDVREWMEREHNFKAKYAPAIASERGYVRLTSKESYVQNQAEGLGNHQVQS